MSVTITQLNKYIKRIIENDIHLTQVTVTGEISNYKRHSSGHLYLTLKDEQSAISAVMFRASADKLRFEPENGMKVTATGRVSVYERDGKYQIYLSSMSPDGIGDLYVAYEQLKEKLEKEGLFDKTKKKPIPKYPLAVGVITSPTGAAVRDIINVATRRFPMAEIILCPVLVQGENAAGQISRAIEFMNENKMCDCIITGRGGGSIEDLWAFNEECVAYAIYNSKIPVISAVGHETDFTIADFVADLRAPTPSAAAELAVPSANELKTSIQQYYGRMLYSLNKNVEHKRAVLSSFDVKNPLDFIDQCRIRTDNNMHRINSSVMNIMGEKSKQLAVRCAKLDSLSPLGVLGRGYAVAQSEGKVLKSAKSIKVGDKVDIILKDGTVNCVAKKIQLKGADCNG